ncbi:hypothetical protein F441_21325 [Phytophthora nicotianae CJ01A1]|uniref:DUF659 domain-containing protein n=1 Tax=Phytophthora nicotianae CJ01A1 TaxID=1317063 RepID=W2VTB0_PHYNI|nr:hypothetical protein F441_21325 [Phytophthora nicotianae CJ01A1]
MSSQKNKHKEPPPEEADSELDLFDEDSDVEPTQVALSTQATAAVRTGEVDDDGESNWTIKVTNEERCHNHITNETIYTALKQCNDLVSLPVSTQQVRSLMNCFKIRPELIASDSRSPTNSKNVKSYCGIAGDLDKVLEDVNASTSAQVVSVITDNAKKIRSATSRVYICRPNIGDGGCSAHVLNLLMQDIFKVPAFRKIRRRAVTVARFVKNHLE